MVGVGEATDAAAEGRVRFTRVLAWASGIGIGISVPPAILSLVNHPELVWWRPVSVVIVLVSWAIALWIWVPLEKPLKNAFRSELEGAGIALPPGPEQAKLMLRMQAPPTSWRRSLAIALALTEGTSLRSSAKRAAELEASQNAIVREWKIFYNAAAWKFRKAGFKAVLPYAGAPLLFVPLLVVVDPPSWLATVALSAFLGFLQFYSIGYLLIAEWRRTRQVQKDWAAAFRAVFRQDANTSATV